MGWNTRVRQTHRWVSVVFTVTVLANVATMALSSSPPPPWVTFAPLPPLGLLLLTGLYLFVLPYLATRRARSRLE